MYFLFQLNLFLFKLQINLSLSHTKKEKKPSGQQYIHNSGSEV